MNGPRTLRRLQLSGWLLRTMIVFALSASCVLSPSPGTAQDLLTQHNDNQRTGANNRETVLNITNVNDQDFGWLFDVKVDGAIYAQPLYLQRTPILSPVGAICGPSRCPGVVIANVVYVGTMNDKIHAIDANTGFVYWTSLLSQLALNRDSWTG